MDVQIDRYAYWREALKGNFGPVHDSDPQSGFYRKRKFRSGPFLPVAIWFDDASGAYVALVDGQAANAEEVWTYVCRYPVTEEAYRDRVAGKPWPDEDPGVTASLEAPTTIGSNNPPKDQAVILAEQIDANCKSASAYAEIKDDETAGKAQSCRSRLLELGGQADKKREDEKRPHLEAGRAVDAKWQPIVKKAKDAAGAILRALNAHENRKLEEQREAARKAAEAAAKAEAARRAAEKAGKPVPPPAEPARLPEPQPIQTQIRGGYGRAASKRMVKVVTVTDIDAAFGFLKSEQELVDLIGRLAQRAVDAGNTVPGTTVKEEISCR